MKLLCKSKIYNVTVQLKVYSKVHIFGALKKIRSHMSNILVGKKMFKRISSEVVLCLIAKSISFVTYHYFLYQIK